MTRKIRVNISPSQKLEYAKLMVEEGYTNKLIRNISGACSSAISRWKDNILMKYQAIPQKKIMC